MSVIRLNRFKPKKRRETKKDCKKTTALLGNEGVAFDCNAYKDAPAGLRFWCGATVKAGEGGNDGCDQIGLMIK